MQTKKEQSALVLSGGGALGMAQIGVLKHIESNYNFDFLCGVSAGSIVAAALACGKSAQEVADTLHAQHFYKMLFEFSDSGFGMLRAQKMLNFLEEFYEGREFKDIPSSKKLFVFATDFKSGDQKVFTKGSIAKAVRASISVPIVFEPFHYGDDWFVDGGISQNFPLDYAVEHYTGSRIVGIDVITEVYEDIDLSEKKRLVKLSATIERTLRIMYKNQKRLGMQDPRVKLYKPHLAGFRTSDIGKLREIEIAGEKCVQGERCC